MAVDAGYKPPHILLDEEVRPVMPYTRPRTKKGYLRKHDDVYDEYDDCFRDRYFPTERPRGKDIDNTRRTQRFAERVLSLINVHTAETAASKFIVIFGKMIWMKWNI